MQFNFTHFTQAHILIIGDVMLDRYWTGKTGRISPEAPVPIVDIKHSQEHPGGAGNVALNLATLGAHATLLGYCGDDQAGEILANKLQDLKVACHLIRIKSAATITKTRVISFNQQLLRMDVEEKYQPSIDDQVELWELFINLVPSVQVIILSDYSKGTLRNVMRYIEYAKSFGIPILVDPKGSDFSIYRSASLLTPNLKEFEEVSGVSHSLEELSTKAQLLLELHDLGSLLITQGDQGMSLFRLNMKPLHLPAHSHEVFDVTGAGDTVIATMGLGFALKYPLTESVYLANLAASIVVGKLGAAPILPTELEKALLKDSNLSSSHKIVSLPELMNKIELLRQKGKKIVMAGGCFDIIHYGHLSYLRMAKMLGDYLIVAINHDETIRLLKGSTRPIHRLEERMAVLAELLSVDWIIPFTEMTPEALIDQIQPDIWAKGGDYQLDRLPESTKVLKYGGEIKILPFIKGYSTSFIIEQLNKQDC